MPPPVQPPMMRGPVIAVHLPDRGADVGAGPGAMGPAMRGAVGANPVRRRLAQAIRGGGMPF